jgi:anaerobic selenocysteine-containing dehydrogenase
MLNSTRRDLLTVSGGALAGLFLSPVPWKLLDDVAIWSQNWSWIPRPPRGEPNTRYTACTLCPAGCGVTARCIDAQPIGLAGVPQHPASDGSLCTIGVGAHQLPYHPARLAAAPAAIDAAMKEVAKARSQGVRVAFLDLRPGRAASAVYRKFALGFPGGLYLAPAPAESATLRAVAKLAGEPVERLGIDWENAGTVVSVGAPLLETPGRALRAWREKKLRIVQVDREQTHTAALAGRWLTSWDDAEVRKESPSFVISGGLAPQAEEILAAVNADLGAVGRKGGIVRRAASPVPEVPYTPLDSVADASIGLLFIDHGPLAAWPAGIEKKLAANAVVISFSPFGGERLKRASYILPAPAFLEVSDDVVTPWDAVSPSYGIAPALLKAPRGIEAPAEVLAALDPALKGAVEAEMKSRVAAIHAAKRGEILAFAGGARTKVKEIESADKLWEQFQKGAYWVDGSPPPASPLHCRKPGETARVIEPPSRGPRFGDATVVPPLAMRVPA